MSPAADRAGTAEPKIRSASHRAAEERRRADEARQRLLDGIAEFMDGERDLLARMAEQSALLDLAPDPIFARDAARHITFWNEAARQIYGFTQDEALGRNPGQLLRTLYPIPLDEIERLVKQDGIWEGDLVHTTKDGRRLTVASRWGALYDDDGELAGLLEVNRDITERIEAEARHAELERARMSERLVRAQRLESLGQLAGGVAHDFNNLLAIITGYAAVMTRRLDSATAQLDPEQHAFLSNGLAQITQAGERASTLTHQLLAFARQESVEAEILDINATIEEMLDMLGRTLGPHIVLSTDLDPQLPAAHIDSGQLGQILVNLAVNSRDAMPDGGTLTISTSAADFDADRTLTHGTLRAGSYVRIRVEDSGAGMTREVLEHAFDPFFTTRPVGEGTGLGLATVYGIVSQAGGQVTLYSEPGEGTAVTILLPAVGGSADAPADTVAEEPPQARRRATVLVVEDEEALLTLTASSVRDAGYGVISAEGGRQALEAARRSEEPIDLLLTDVVMPQMLGQQLAEEIRRDHPGIKVLFMSGFARPMVGDARRPLDGPLLMKPFTEAELLSEIARLLDDETG